MEKKDMRVLAGLISDYSFKEVVQALAHFASDKADEMSDMYLKERAVVWSVNAELLEEVSNQISE